MQEITNLKAIVEQERGKYDRLRFEYQKTVQELDTLEKRERFIEQAKTILQTVGQMTQQQLEYFISDIVSLALATVFDDPYKFKTEFVLKRGKTECELWFERNGQLINPLDASGGGVVDVASFALRMSLWSLHKNRHVVILDEPFKHLSQNLHAKALLMLKELSSKLGIQIIMISHSSELVAEADKVIALRMEKGTTLVE